MADYRPGEVVVNEFTTQVFATGVATTADSLPVGTINRNGTDDAAVAVTVLLLDAGRYSATFTLPQSYLIGDTVTLTIAATVSTVAGKAVIWTQRLGIGVPFETGFAQGGSSGSSVAPGVPSSITLRSGASSVNDFFKDQVIFLLSGTGAGETNRITAYNGLSKVATVETPWVSPPDVTTRYIVLGRVG